MKMESKKMLVMAFGLGLLFDVCSCQNITVNSLNPDQGPPGKRGPPGRPGDVIQCGCNTSGIWQDLQDLKNELEEFRKSQTPPRSCKEIADKSNSPKRNGLYKLRDSLEDEFFTYCDMETDGGGWTLVASIHDNNPYETGRCTAGDRWSSERGISDRFPKGDMNWENMNTFGEVKLAALDDFKNPGYFELHSQNVMIWQVPNGTPPQNFSRDSYVKYRTRNGFLSQFGGNLQRLYSKHFPIKSKAYSLSDQGPSIPVVFDKGSEESLKQHFSPSLVAQGLDLGYIQFRPISTNGFAYALCPGFQFISRAAKYPGRGCLGSTGQVEHIRSCGDTTSYHEGHTSYKTGWTADKLLIESTYFIFYR